MIEDEKDGTRPNSFSITGRNAALAAAVGLIATVILGAIVICARIAFDLSDGRSVDPVSMGTEFVTGLPGLFLCVGPIVFIPAFALLQRAKFGG